MHFNYKKMRITTTLKLIVMVLLALVPAVVILRDIRVHDFHNVSIILPFARMTTLVIGECLIAYKIISYVKILISEERAYNHYINKKDERNQYLFSKIVGQTSFVAILLEILGVIICSYVSLEGLMVLLALILGELIIFFISYIYFTSKN